MRLARRWNRPPAFVREKGLVTLSERSNLQVIETPEFMRGIYGVGGFDPAPALEPQLGAFYWITPIPKDWPKERIESKLREYNNYGLQELTIHEAMPGHYVQFEYANDVQPQARRLLRSVFSNTPYVEGWAFYTQQMMSDEGYLNNSKELRLSFYKQALRALANTILDVRLQTMGMTDQQALDLMIERYVPGKGRSHGQAAAGAAFLLPASDLFRGLEGLAGGAGAVQAEARRGVLPCARSTTGRSRKARFRCRCWSSCCNNLAHPPNARPLASAR